LYVMRDFGCPEVSVRYCITYNKYLLNPLGQIICTKMTERVSCRTSLLA